VRVVIGEDSALFREGLARLLEDAGHEVVAKAVDAPSLVRAVDTELPDLAIVDVRMPPDNTDDGARAARRLRETHPELGIVLLSQHIETHHSVELVSSRTTRSSWSARVASATCSKTASSTSTTSSTRSSV
jgi:DNA-binding NarL/FixJ family response regulator